MPAESRGSSWNPQSDAGQAICRRSTPLIAMGELQIGQFISSVVGRVSDAAASASISTEPIDRIPGHRGLALHTQIPAVSNSRMAPPQMEQATALVVSSPGASTSVMRPRSSVSALPIPRSWRISCTKSRDSNRSMDSRLSLWERMLRLPCQRIRPSIAATFSCIPGRQSTCTPRVSRLRTAPG